MTETLRFCLYNEQTLKMSSKIVSKFFLFLHYLELQTNKNNTCVGTYYVNIKKINIWLKNFKLVKEKLNLTEDQLIESISRTITHEYVHLILDEYDVPFKKHHFSIEKIGLMG